MAYLTWVVRILLFLVLLGFSVRNLEPVHVHGFLGYEWHAPLVLVMLVALVVGVLLGAAGALRAALFLRRPEPFGPPEAPEAVRASAAAPGPDRAPHDQGA